MNDFKQFVLGKLETLHLKLHYGQHYDLNSSRELTKRLEDLGRYEQLLEVARENPDWDNEEISKELAERIRKKTSLR
ncbi:hypothetical protein Goe20_01590 [Bacillus phage vB_BsuM-Goe20]|nr:hypothetical protein Goe20_01590 [Bacillus phage vB_BsuM-Goe20]